MFLERIKPWLDLIGSVAILLGLVAVAIEIRFNSNAVRSQELAIYNELSQERVFKNLEPNFVGLYIKSLEQPTRLTKSELWSLTTYLNSYVLTAARAHDAYRSGILLEADWYSELVGLPFLLDTDFGQVVWSMLKEDYADVPDFVAAVDQAILEHSGLGNDVFLDELQQRLSVIDRPSGDE